MRESECSTIHMHVWSTTGKHSCLPRVAPRDKVLVSATCQLVPMRISLRLLPPYIAMKKQNFLNKMYEMATDLQNAVGNRRPPACCFFIFKSL